jgi:DNA-binding transcriptional LysR family regulator
MGQLDLNAAFIFTQVVAAGSFRAASAQLGIPKTNVSRKVAELEAHLGVRLLQRTTRSLSLTDAGIAFMTQAENAISYMQAAEDAVTAIQVEPRGRIRISAPNLLANTLLPPILADFMQAYPHVELVLQLTNRHVDLVSERIDVAIRVGSLEDSSLMTTTIGQASMVLVASPGYLKRHGTPEHPDELTNLACLVFAVQEAANPSVWKLGKGRMACEVILKNRPLICDDMNVIMSMALLGQGIARLPKPFVVEACASNQLQEILSAWAKDTAPMQLVYPNAKHLLPATRAFIDFVKPRLSMRGQHV